MPKLELMIIYDTETGSIRVDGPIHNKILSLGMLEVAKDTILKFKPPQESKLTVPGIVLPGGMPRG